MNVYSEISDLGRCKLIMFIFKPQWVDLALFLQMGVDLALFLQMGADLKIRLKKLLLRKAIKPFNQLFIHSKLLNKHNDSRGIPWNLPIHG